MVTLNQLIPVEVSFTVPGKELLDLQKYQSAGSLQVLLTDIKSEPLAGKLTFVDNRIDSSTGTLLLKATFANRDRDLWPGQFVDVRLVLTMREKAVVVPSQAIQVRQDGSHIYVVGEDQRVEDRLVTTSMIVEKETVIEKGLVGSEKIVTNGQFQLSDGVKVQERKKQAAEPSEKSVSSENKGTEKS